MAHRDNGREPHRQRLKQFTADGIERSQIADIVGIGESVDHFDRGGVDGHVLDRAVERDKIQTAGIRRHGGNAQVRIEGHIRRIPGKIHFPQQERTIRLLHVHERDAERPGRHRRDRRSARGALLGADGFGLALQDNTRQCAGDSRTAVERIGPRVDLGVIGCAVSVRVFLEIGCADDELGGIAQAVQVAVHTDVLTELDIGHREVDARTRRREVRPADRARFEVIDPFAVRCVRREHNAIGTERLSRIERDAVTHDVTGGQVFNGDVERPADDRGHIGREIVAQTDELHTVQGHGAARVGGHQDIQPAVEHFHTILRSDQLTGQRRDEPAPRAFQRDDHGVVRDRIAAQGERQFVNAVRHSDGELRVRAFDDGTGRAGYRAQRRDAARLPAEAGLIGVDVRQRHRIEARQIARAGCAQPIGPAEWRQCRNGGVDRQRAQHALVSGRRHGGQRERIGRVHVHHIAHVSQRGD